ncbi:DUF2273 domain-containing protein [Nonomuraea sp. NPDC050547]|uniref:Nitrate/nitrite transporter NarK n=1 Tax=Nonomuraea endophytica TaxID=714136 RepID=A0A7W8A1S8_9ACTN|nr:DUF2273 domain-containing protein [Nonomuraea endophytica]MBB5076863.1 nitrate/nitrite transporter NarK [Nonomuraea endophytica]
MTNHPLSIIGMAVGMVLGLAGAFGGIGAFLLVLLLGALGFLVGRLAEGGEVNVAHLTVRRK